MYLTLGQFAKAANLSKPHVSKLIKTGKISAIKQPNGSYQIDPSELDRFLGNRVPATPSEPLETLWENERKALVALVNTLQAQLADLQGDRDAWRSQAERLLLTPPQQPPKRLWRDWWRSR